MTGKLNALGDLSAASIAFFVPALCIALYVNVRHGFSKQLGWFYLVLLSIFRLVGAVCIIYMEVANDYSVALVTVAAIMNAIGMAPLALALMGFLERVNNGMGREKGLSMRIFKPIHLCALAGLILAIAACVQLSSADGRKDSDFSVGHKLQATAAMLFFVIILALGIINVVLVSRREYIVPGERKLAFAGIVALPFLLVRIIYAVIVAFTTSTSSPFYYTNITVWAEAFMRFLPEAVVVTLFIVTGLLTPKVGEPRSQIASKEVELGHGTTSAEESSQQQGALSGYRPGRLIRKAWNSRS